MDAQAIEQIELELAFLVRHATSISTYTGNIDRSAYLLLHHITTQASVGVKSLAEEFNLDISTVSRQTAALEQRGFVVRVPDQADRRAYFFQITESGTLALAEHRNARLARVSKKLEGWSDEECRLFGKLLEKLNNTIRG